jgi:hypothetical protein
MNKITQYLTPLTLESIYADLIEALGHYPTPSPARREIKDAISAVVEQYLALTGEDLEAK